MVINHVGYKLLSPSSTTLPIINEILFITSFAPVLFFYATGFGIGLQNIKPQKTPWKSNSIFRKCLLLLLADIFLRNTLPNNIIGMDFFGFIAISTITVYLIAKSSNPLVFATIVGCLIIFVRFLPPTFDIIGALPDFVSGRQSTPGVSYPLAPWIAFPILGYLTSHVTSRKARHLLLFGVGLTAFAATMIMHGRGMTLHRWATMSAAYFAASIAVIGLLHGTLDIIKDTPATSKYLPQLNGIESFLIVPIHYFIISLSPAISNTSATLHHYVLFSVAISLPTFYLSRHCTLLFKKARRIYRLGEPVFFATCLIFTLIEWINKIWWEAPFDNVLTLGALLLIGYKLQNNKSLTNKNSRSPIST